MALYIPQSILHLARSLYVRPETYGPTYVYWSKIEPTVSDEYVEKGMEPLAVRAVGLSFEKKG